jgi:hypothetical protein
MLTATAEILLEEGYRSTDGLFRGWALLTAMSRVEQYQAECEAFQKKYGRSLTEFERRMHSSQGREDFAAEDDLDDWAFASEALRWWRSKTEELRIAAAT